MYHELGKPIIDELKLCYRANETILDDLRKTDDSLTVGEFTFYRTTSHHFRYAYDIRTWKGRKVATARCGRYGDEDSDYFFFRVENDVLYDHDMLTLTLALPEQMGMLFNNYTSIDIAIDSKTDIALLMKRMWHRKDITTIVNGKAIKDRTDIIKNVSLVYSTTLDRLKSLTVYVKQAKALHDKTKGVTVQAYNKLREIEDASHKEYIREYYGNPKKLHRLEVHLNNADIQDYCKMRGIVASSDMIWDETILDDMFFYHLSSVIRYTKGRTKLSWKDIFQCNGRL